jgi:glycosyltransferase involved in cell wall biosynthesis
VVENGVPVPADRATNPGDGPSKVVFLGQLAETKGVFDLIAAAARVDIKAELVLAGPEAEAGLAAALHAQAERLDLGWTLSTPGAVQGQEKAALLDAATLFVLPSYFEGMPMSLLEAMALGVPVVCTAVGAIPTVVENEHSGLLVPAGDVSALAEALRRLLSEPELRDRIGRAGREVCAERFGIERAVEKLKSIYAELLGMSRFECWGGVSR